MQKFRIENFLRGWFIGDFCPSVLKTKDFEVGVLTHYKNENWPEHYQKIATEFNVLISGSLSINNETFIPGDIFIIKPGEIIKPIFNEDCIVVCIKVPSIPNDKHEIKKND
jgi:hypothetical protein